MFPLLLLLAAEAHARCSIQQEAVDGGIRVRVHADAAPVRCHVVSLSADGAPLEVTARVVDATDRARRVPKRDVVAAAGALEVRAPALDVGGALEILARTDASSLVVRVGAAPRAAAAAHADVERTMLLDRRHPAWGFADATLARTDIRAAYTFDVAAEGAADARVLPLPAATTGLDAAGLAERPGGLRIPVEGGAFALHLASPGAAPQGREHIPPGSLTLRAPGAELVASTGPGVTWTALPDGARFEAPHGGEVRWRVLRAGGMDVIPDAATYVRGLDWRFAGVSLPEPAVPIALHGEPDRAVLLDALVALARELRDVRLPDADPLRPRSLLAVVRSGWATSVERALVLHRMLGQERFAARWVLTGADPDPRTLTGYDTMLLVVENDGERVWIDPGCATCTLGEVRPELLGKPAIGGAEEVPSAPGLIERQVRLVGTRFETRFVASGAAALALREATAAADPAQRDAILVALLGASQASVTAREGLDAPGSRVVVSVTGEAPPSDPFAGAELPWTGGWRDAPP